MEARVAESLSLHQLLVLKKAIAELKIDIVEVCVGSKTIDIIDCVAN